MSKANAILVNVLRTVVPIIVGAIVAALAKAGITGLDGVATELVTTVCTVLYWAVFRALETKVGPAWGWLLGYAQVPSYGSVPAAPAPEFNAVGDYGDPS